MESHRSVIDVVEESLGEALDANFIADLDRLTVDDLEALKLDYDTFARDQVTPAPATGEFWPVSHRLIPMGGLERSQQHADIATQRALSQLLYAHGAVVPDRLGSLLTDAVNPRSSGSKRPQWEASDLTKMDLANYLEVLAFLRPLVDAGLLILRPRAVRGLGFLPGRGYFYTDEDGQFDESDLSAIEFELGRDVRVIYEEERDRALREKGHFSSGSVLGEFDPDRRWAMTTAFEYLFRKFTDFAKGSPGHLNLETHQEREAFTWLVEQNRGSPGAHPETENLSIADGLLVPNLSALQPTDVVALHQSDAWLEYRLALRRGLDRASKLDDLSREEALAVVREEMQLIEQSVARTSKQSRFVEARANAGKDLVIGTVVAAGAMPAIGLSGAAVGLAMGSARTASGLLWAWLRSGDRGDEDAVARCFGALG
jgi:hypothetical protein